MKCTVVCTMYHVVPHLFLSSRKLTHALCNCGAQQLVNGDAQVYILGASALYYIQLQMHKT